jgi:hypothetical protein
MATIQKFEDLEVWQKARILSVEVLHLNIQGTSFIRLQVERSDERIVWFNNG